MAARDPGRAETFAARSGVERVHDTYRDVIDDLDVDVVYNALVNSLHTMWNVAALRPGKHVLSEKPMSSNGTAARAVREAARQTGCYVLSVARHVCRWIREEPVLERVLVRRREHVGAG